METRKIKNLWLKTVVVMCLLISICAAAAACKDGETPVDDSRTFEESWMSFISDDATVGEIAIVGSHDAGTFGAGTAYATQHSTIEQQLYAGVRYFDFRATTNAYVDNTYYFIHANSDMPAWGGAATYGQPVKDSLNAIKAFIERNPAEVLILDFQHTWVDTEEGLIELIKNTLPMQKVLTKTDCSNPSEITMGKMRELGKNVIIIYKDTSSDICEENDFLFERSQYLQSDYVGNEHKGDAQRLKTQWQKYFSAKKDDVIFILQSQLTGSPLEDREALIRPVLDEFLKDIAANDADKLAAINVVMKDFVADDVADCEISSADAIHTILSLNVDKGLVQAEMLDSYKTACAYGN